MIGAYCFGGSEWVGRWVENPGILHARSEAEAGGLGSCTRGSYISSKEGDALPTECPRWPCFVVLCFFDSGLKKQIPLSAEKGQHRLQPQRRPCRTGTASPCHVPIQWAQQQPLRHLRGSTRQSPEGGSGRPGEHRGPSFSWGRCAWRAGAGAWRAGARGQTGAIQIE